MTTTQRKMEEAIAGISGSSLLDIGTLKETFQFHWSAWKSIGKGKSLNNLASQNDKKPEMKLLVTAQALGTHADPADPDYFRSSPPCTASLSPLGGDSDSPLVSLELSQLPPREAWMPETCYSPSHTSRSATVLIHSIQRLNAKIMSGKIIYSNKIMVHLLFPILSFI